MGPPIEWGQRHLVGRGVQQHLMVLDHLHHTGGAERVAARQQTAAQVGRKAPLRAGDVLVQQGRQAGVAVDQPEVHEVDRPEAAERVVHVDVQLARHVADVQDAGHAVGVTRGHGRWPGSCRSARGRRWWAGRWPSRHQPPAPAAARRSGRTPPRRPTWGSSRTAAAGRSTPSLRPLRLSSM